MTTSKLSVHQIARLKKGPAASKPVPPREEWDFEETRVPESELHHCLYYEYAREQANASPLWRTLVSDFAGGKTKRCSDCIKTHNAVFGSFRVWPIYLEERFLTTPWQSLKASERNQLCKDVKIPSLESFTMSVALHLTLVRDLAEYSAAGATSFASWRLLDQCFHTEQAQREHGFLAVNWDYTDEVLKEQFAAWLIEKRGERMATTSEQGKSKPRPWLKALGAKRLQDAGLSVPDAQVHTMGFLKDKEGHPRALYEANRSWSDAKRKTVPETLARLFGAGSPSPEGASL